MCVNYSALTGCLILTAFGLYYFVKSRRHDPDFIPKDDGGTGSWFFYICCMQLYYLIKREKKYQKNFPNNYFKLLQFVGAWLILAGLFFSYLSLYAC